MKTEKYSFLFKIIGKKINFSFFVRKLTFPVARRQQFPKQKAKSPTGIV